MKKAEELKLYAPEPKRPELDAALCMSVAEGQGVGRYIKGKVLTVAVWDKKEKLEVLLASAVHLLDCWEDISAETGEEPENYGEQRAILQAEYDAIKC